jgi:hypothetical protein
MYIKGNITVSDSEAAEEGKDLNLDAKAWAEKFGYTYKEGEPGKTSGSVQSDTASSLEDISLDSPEINNKPYLLNINDFQDKDGNFISNQAVENKVRSKLRSVGLKIDQVDALFGLATERINISRVDSRKTTAALPEDFAQFKIGDLEDLSPEERAKRIQKINDHIEKYKIEDYGKTSSDQMVKLPASLREQFDGATEVKASDLLSIQKNLIDSKTGLKEDFDEQKYLENKFEELISYAKKQVTKARAAGGIPVSSLPEEDLLISGKLSKNDFKSFAKDIGLGDDIDQEYKEYLDYLDGNLNLKDTRRSFLKDKGYAESQKNIASQIARSLSDETREVLETVTSYESQQLVNKYESYTIARKNLENFAKQLEKEVEKLPLIDGKIDGSKVSEEKIESLKAQKARFDAAKLRLEKDEADIKSLQEDFKSEELELLAREFALDYSLMSKLQSGFESTAIKIGYGAYQLLSGLGSGIVYNDFYKGFNKAKEDFKEILQEDALESQSLAQGVEFGKIFEEGDVYTGEITRGNVLRNMVNWAADTTIQAIPSLSMAFTGPAAMPLFFLSGYGSRAAEFAVKEYEAADTLLNVKKTFDEAGFEQIIDSQGNKSEYQFTEGRGLTREEFDELNKKAKEAQEIINMPEWKQLSVSAIAGAAEVFTERLGTIAILRGANKVVSAIPTKKMIVKSIAASANQEGLSEGATELINNFAKIGILGEDVNLFDGVAESYFGGALIGGPLELKHAAPAAYAHMAHEAMNKQEIAEYRNKIDKLKSLTNIKDLDKVLDSRLSLPPGIPPATVKIIKEVQNEALQIQDAAIARLSQRLNTEQRFELGEINLKIRQVNRQLIEVAKGTASQSQLKAAKEQLQEKFDKLNNERNELLSNVASDAEIARVQGELAFKDASNIVFANEVQLKENTSNQAFDKLSGKEKRRRLAESNNSEAQAKKDFYLENNNKKLEENKNKALNLKEAFGENAPEFVELTDAQYKARFGQDAGSTGEFNVDENVIYINKELAADNAQTGVYTHEMFHAITRQSIGDGKANAAGEQLLQYLEQNSSETFTYIKNKLDTFYTEGDVKDAAYYEEAITALSDYINEGNTVDLSAIAKIRSFFNNIRLPGKTKSLNLDSGRETFEFIVQYSKNSNNKKAEAAVAKFIQENEAPIEETEATQKTKASAAADRARATLARVQEEGIEGNDLQIYETVQGMAQAQLSKFANKGLRINDMQEAVADVVGRLYTQRDIGKFDGRGTLYGYLNGRIGFRIKDAFKANPIWVEDFGGVAVEDISGKEAKQIATQEEVTTPTKEVPTYKPLQKRNVLSKDRTDAVKNKVRSTVRVMKTRMDEAVSKNVTVKPYIAEIKKTMGKQADIEFKKEMGGLKDGQLRKYLLKNKAAILENMTTTYLMTAMPNAVQKQVDGVFTSDWKGKKIDREKVTTDQAGRTSGAEIVRRLPNAGTRLSDADFLSNFFTADGKLIRGRKESLAKAMAEELSFEIVNEALQDPNSEISQAFKQNQELKGVVLTENFVTEVARDIERGNVKRSAAVRKAVTKNGVIDKNKLTQWEAGKQDLSARLAGISGGINSKNLRAELEAVYGDLFTRGQYTQISKELAKVFKDVNAIELQAVAAVTGDFMQILQGMSNQVDFGEKVHALTKAATSVTELFRDKNNILEAKNILIDIITKANVPVDIAKTFINSTFANSGKIGQYKKNGEIGGTSRADLFYDTADVVSALVGEGKLYTQEQWDNAETTATSASVQAKYLNGKFKASKELQDQDAKAADKAWNLTTEIVKGLKGKSPEMQAMIMAAMNSGTNTVLRLAAPVTHIAKGFNSKNAGDYRYEHVVPARVVLSLMYKHYVQGDNSLNMKALKKDYTVAIIPKSMDKVIGEAGLGAIQMHGYIPGEVSPWGRYYNPLTKGKTQYAVESFRDGSIEGQSYADAFKQLETFRVNNKAYNQATQKVKEINSKPIKKSAKAVRDKLSQEFNEILERKTGVESFKTFSDVQAEIRGRKKGKFKFFVAPAVEDFRGLVNYAFAGRGKQGEKDMAWMEEKLMTPYAKGIAAIDGIRQQIKKDFKLAVKSYPKQYKLLSKEIPGTNFTYDQAVRVYLWQKSGFDVPGLSRKDAKIFKDAIQQNPELIDFANSMLVVGRRTEWIEPSEYWLGGSILGDLNEMTDKVGRKEYLAEFIENAELIFSKENLNKIEALFGKSHREAIQDSLYSMINGTNRQQGQSKIVGKWLNWLNGSTGAIMFFNRRSALLQMLSTTNFINYSDNNILKAGAAFANQKQYWADWSMIFNSDKLRERRGGLRQDVSANEIASVANDSKNSPKAIIAYLLKIGFKPTQLADSFAIATGGAAFYRNRVNTYLKEGKTEKEAKEQAFLDFSKISDETQQSSDPALVSQIQRSVLGRLVFAFQNTPMQITRLIKKDALDLINGRGDWKVKVSRIAYYGAVQNLIFSSLQSALFALIPGFDDDEEDKLTDKELEKRNKQDEARITRALNSMLDTLLRGSGVYGAVFATAKNAIREYMKQEEKGFLGDDAYTILSLFDISPPIGSKARKINSAIKTRKFEKDEIAARGWAITGEGRLDLGPNWSILGKVTSATLNLPLDRVVDELTSVSEAFDARNTAWQRFALALGWKTWDVGAKDELGEAIKAEAGIRRKEESKRKAAEKRRKKAEEKKAIEAAKTPEQKEAERKEKEAEKEAKRKEKEAKRRKVVKDESIVDQEAIYDLIKAQQIEILDNLGLSESSIKKLKTEKQRVDKIIELRNKIKK